MITVALDPSINSCGLAVFNHDELVFGANVKNTVGTEEKIGVRCLRMAAAVLEVLGRNNLTNVHTLVFEWPQILRNTKSKGDPNDLPGMAGTGMSLATLLAVHNAANGGLRELETPHPNDWIHSCPKACQKCKKTPGSKKCPACKGSAWRTPRGYRIAESLGPRECSLVPDQHDAVDAAGLGAWKRGRLVLGRVFPGAV